MSNTETDHTFKEQTPGLALTGGPSVCVGYVCGLSRTKAHARARVLGE